MQCHPGSRSQKHYPVELSCFAAALALTAASLFSCAGAAYGRDLDSGGIEIYLDAAFSNFRTKLIKPGTLGPFSYRIFCLNVTHDKCTSAVLNKLYRGLPLWHNRFRLKGKSISPDITYVYTNTNGAIAKKVELTNLYAKQFTDSADPDCQLYYMIRNDVIEKTTIVISLDSPLPKQKLCLAYQTQQSTGLSLPGNMSFSVVWESPPAGKSYFNAADLNRIAESLRLLSYIHMCPDLKAGMSRDEAKRVLSAPNTCLDGTREYVP